MVKIKIFEIGSCQSMGEREGRQEEENNESGSKGRQDGWKESEDSDGGKIKNRLSTNIHRCVCI